MMELTHLLKYQLQLSEWLMAEVLSRFADTTCRARQLQ